MGEFYRSRASTDGWDGRCKECDRLINRAKHQAKPRLSQPTVEQKARIHPFSFFRLFSLLSPEVRSLAGAACPLHTWSSRSGAAMPSWSD